MPYDTRKEATMFSPRLFREIKFRCHVMLDRFKSETQGVAAVEFALIAPLMILLFLGTLEVSTAVAVNRKVSRVSSTVADLITQSNTLSSDQLDDIMESASYVMRPYDHTVSIIVTGINIEDGTGEIEWSCPYNATGLIVGQPYTVPDKIKIDGTFLVAAKVSVTHNPMVSFVSMGPKRSLDFDTTAIPMEEEIFLRPRREESTVNC